MPGYVRDLTEVSDNPEVFVGNRNVPIPEDMSAQFDKPLKEELVSRHVSLFNPVVAGSQRSFPQHQEPPGESSGQ